MSENPFSLKHRPVFLLPYEPHDGPYAGDTDCKYLSVGFAQYDSGRSVSVKTLRHTGEKWSRQSEEIPMHRAVDCVSLIALAVEAALSGKQSIGIEPEFLENQDEPIQIENSAEGAKRDAFARKVSDELIRRRLCRLRGILERLHAAGQI